MAGCPLRSGSIRDVCGTFGGLLQHSRIFPVAMTMIEMNGMRFCIDPRKSDMARIKLKYVVEDLDRHGNIRRYFRRKGQPKIRLSGLPGSEEFMEAYRSALANLPEDRPRTVGRPAIGSFGHVCLSYYASPTFKRLSPSTQSWRRRALDSICEKHGDKRIAGMNAKHVRVLRNEMAKLPGASRNRLKALKALFAWAVDEGLRDRRSNAWRQKHCLRHEIASHMDSR